VGEGKHGVGAAGFFSISTLRSIIRPRPDGGEGGKIEYLYKVFSPEQFTDDKLRAILGIKEVDDQTAAVPWIYRHVWEAYPYEYPRVTFEESKLADGLWYTAGIESFISTMETSSLMGMNVAKLMVDEWTTEKKLEAAEHDELVVVVTNNTVLVEEQALAKGESTSKAKL
jgi:prenylcysteine oxidase/farnesylcysteine lyase